MVKYALFAAWVLMVPAAAFAMDGADTPSGGTVAAAPTAAEAEAAFHAAQQAYRAVSAGGPAQAEGDIEQAVTPTMIMVPGGQSDVTRLEEVKLVIDAENVTLRQVVGDVVRQAAEHTGPWMVKWRLKPENMALMDERVNLTAESTFSDFFALLAERVKNMTGTQLFITVFSGSRIILVADTYY